LFRFGSGDKSKRIAQSVACSCFYFTRVFIATQVVGLKIPFYLNGNEFIRLNFGAIRDENKVAEKENATP
jgi:hypothetical protein